MSYTAVIRTLPKESESFARSSLSKSGQMDNLPRDYYQSGVNSEYVVFVSENFGF